MYDAQGIPNEPLRGFHASLGKYGRCYGISFQQTLAVCWTKPIYKQVGWEINIILALCWLLNIDGCNDQLWNQLSECIILPQLKIVLYAYNFEREICMF